MKVREIMTHDVECVTPDTDIKDVAKRMKSLDVGFIPVCENDRLAGTVTDRDIVIRAIADEECDIQTCKARDVMTKDIFYCFEDQDVEDVAHQMRENEVRRMLILNSDKRLVGVVSIGDLSKVKEKTTGEVLHDITEAA